MTTRAHLYAIDLQKTKTNGGTTYTMLKKILMGLKCVGELFLEVLFWRTVWTLDGVVDNLSGN